MVCMGFGLIPCQKCGGSKNSVANKFTSEFRALRCTHCNENGMELCPLCEEKRRELEEELKKRERETLNGKEESDTTCKRMSDDENEDHKYRDGVIQR